MSVITLKCYDRNKNKLYEGTGIKIDTAIIAHHSITRSHPSALSSKLSDLKFYLIKKNTFINEEISLKIVKTWQCRTFETYFGKYFNEEDFGNNDISKCATFLQMEEESKYNCVPSALDQVSLTLGRKPVRQGMRIRVGKGSTFFSTYRQDGIISYTFASGDFFVINVEAQLGEVVYGLTRNGVYEIGLVIYKDILPFPLQVFPLCISINHLVKQCSTQACKCQSVSPSYNVLPERFNSINNVCLLQCGTNVGSGTLIHESIIMTCSHNVMQHEKNEIVVYFKEKPYQAKVIYKVKDDEYPDIALLEIMSSHGIFQPVILSNENAQIGDIAFALGVPYVKGWYKSDPWISSGRVVQKQLGHIIVSCGVHQGFSGGCVVDLSGRMIGVICGKAFPVEESAKPLRLTQVIPITRIRNDLIEFISSKREEQDKTKLTKQFLLNRETKSNL